MMRVQLPLAWPVILAGLRVATMLVFGISAIAAYVSGPGLGNLVFTGLSRLGSVNATNQALVGAFGIAFLALAFDAVFLVVRRSPSQGGSVPENSDSPAALGIELEHLTKVYPGVRRRR